MGAQLDLQRELVDKITEFAPLDEIRLLLACGAKVNLPVAEGLLPLHYAVYCNNLACVRLLLTRGSWVDSSDDAGYTALHLCSERGFLDTVQLLLRHNARVCFVDRELEGRQRFPVLYKSDEPLRLALDNGHLDCARLLLEHGADPNARYFLGGELARLLDEPPPPSATAAALLAALLLEHGADADAPNRDGLTPLMSVCANRRRLPRHDAPALLAVLFRHGADVNREAVDCRRRCNERRTALHYAVIARSPTLARILIQASYYY